MIELEPHVWAVQGTVRPLPNRVLVCDMEHGDQKLASGLIIPDDNGKERGIRPRMATVYAVGADIDYVKPGDQVLIAHGRWSRGVKVQDAQGHIKVVRMVEAESILCVADVS